MKFTNFPSILSCPSTLLTSIFQTHYYVIDYSLDSKRNLMPIVSQFVLQFEIASPILFHLRSELEMEINNRS